MEIWGIFALVGIIMFGATFGKLQLDRPTTAITNTYNDEFSGNLTQAHHHRYKFYTGTHDDDDVDRIGLSNLTHESEIIESDRQGRCE